MSHRTERWLRGLLLLAVAAVPLLSTGCGEDAEAVDTEPVADEPRRIINVGVETLTARPFTDVIRLTGTVIADRKVSVAAEEGGIVERVLVDKGQRVRAGEAIAVLDDELLRAQRDEARAQAALTQQLWERTRRLFDEDGIGTENEYLQTRYNAEQAKARLALIEARLARMQIRAPFDGILDDRLVEVGSVVAPGSPVGTLVDLEPLKVSAGVPERYAADVATGARAHVVFGSVGQQSDATVDFVGAQVHPGNRTFRVELALASTAEAIKPEMVADVALERRRLDGVIVVPRQALVRTEGGFSAFVTRGTGDAVTAEVRQVELGASANNEVVVLSGLAAGDRLVVLGQTQIANGDRLRIVSPGR